MITLFPTSFMCAACRSPPNGNLRILTQRLHGLEDQSKRYRGMQKVYLGGGCEEMILVFVYKKELKVELLLTLQRNKEGDYS